MHYILNETEEATINIHNKRDKLISEEIAKILKFGLDSPDMTGQSPIGKDTIFKIKHTKKKIPGMQATFRSQKSRKKLFYIKRTAKLRFFSKIYLLPGFQLFHEIFLSEYINVSSLIK